jgi:dethiobiotin synthetase
VNPFCFEPAIAPHIAAQQAGREISTAVIGQTYRELSRKVDWIVVEGVGGWMVPLNVDQSVADIPLSLNLPVIMVVGMRLGCINHAMLTAEAVRSKGCNLSGWIANRLEPEMDVYEENLHTLRAGLDCPFLGAIPHLDHEENDPNQNITINIDVFKS